MGSFGSKLAKPFRNWNIENRAHKIISQDKPRLAPTYKSTHQQIDLVNKLEPDYKAKAQTKDKKLDDYLKQVYVQSTNVEIQDLDSRSNPNRPLPKDRLLHEDFQYGVYEPSEIRPGRVSLRQALEFLANHKSEPEKYTVEYIATEYKLDKEVVENILEYYSLYNVYNKKDDHNQEVVASSIPISLKSGLRVRWTENKDDEKEEEKLRKAFSKHYAHDPLPLEDEKKKLS